MTLRHRPVMKVLGGVAAGSLTLAAVLLVLYLHARLSLHGLASRIISAMNPSVDPCTDFFEYACGTWNREHVIPDDRADYNAFAKLREDVQVKIKGLLESKLVSEDTPDAIRYAKNFYTSCMNTNLLERRQAAPLQALLGELGGWPVLNTSWRGDTFDWVGSMMQLRLLNNRVLMNQWVSSDDKNSSAHVIQLDQCRLGMPGREYYLKDRNDRQLKAYQQFATDVAVLLGADEGIARKEMSDMVDFEIELAKIAMPDSERRDPMALYHKYTIAELYTNITDRMDWRRFLQGLFLTVNISLSDAEEVVVYSPQYLRDMVQLVSNMNNRTLANYMIWRIVKNRVSNLSHKFLSLRQDYNKVLHGTSSDRARWRICTDYANSYFGMPVGRLFVGKFFDSKAKKSALQMIDSIRTAFSELLTQVSWMDEAARRTARQKAEAITEKIGYPDYIMNDTLLNKDYGAMSQDPEKYFENVIKIIRSYARHNMKLLRKSVDKTEWSTTPAVVNAFYSATKNQIMFPAGILQPPFYHDSYPKSINFGGIAMVIGHELTHGFDDKGRQFDLNGNLKQWWSDEVVRNFKRKAQCIIDQYGNYTVPEVNKNLNGRQTQGENIADNGGLKQAYRAYRKWAKDQDPEPYLPGINLTHNQLFFLNFAQIWCGTARPEYYIQAISAGSHSPGKFRVVGSITNSYDFAQAFGCPVGSTMNPRQKCSVW